MTTTLLYRTAAVLLLLFALGHQLGFRRVDPAWGIDQFVGGLKQTRFEVQGATRTYWGFYAGFGFFVTILLVFSAILAWQLGAMPAELLATLRFLRWAFAACYVLIAIMTWRYFFVAPTVFAVLVAIVLASAAWRSV